MMIFNPNRNEEFQRQVKKYIYLTRKDATEKDSFYYKNKKEEMFGILENYNNNKKKFLDEVEINENYSTLLEFCEYFNKLIIDLREEKRKGNNNNNIQTEKEILEIIKKKLIINFDERSSIQHGRWIDENGYFYHSDGLKNRKNALINLIKKEDAALAEALKDINIQSFQRANMSLKEIQKENKDKLNIAVLGKYLQQDENEFFVFPQINDGIVWEELFRVSLCHYLGIKGKKLDIVESLGQQLYSYFNENGEIIASGQSNKIDVRLGDLGLSLKNFQLHNESFKFITKQDIKENSFIKSYNKINIISPKQFLKMIIGINEMRQKDYMESALLNGITYDTKVINKFQPLKDIILLESLTGSMQLSGAARVLVLRNKKTGFFSIRPMNKVMESNIPKNILKEYFRGGIKFSPQENNKKTWDKDELYNLYVERKNKIIESQKEGLSVKLIGDLNNKGEEIYTIT